MIFSLTENFGQLAQLVEHRPYKAGATGSSPVLPTKIQRRVTVLAVTRLSFFQHASQNQVCNKQQTK